MNECVMLEDTEWGMSLEIIIDFVMNLCKLLTASIFAMYAVFECEQYQLGGKRV